MGKIKEWFSDYPAVIWIAFLLLCCLGFSIIKEFFDNTYSKFYPNEYSYTIAVDEFKRIIPEYGVEKDDEYESEYYEFYDNKSEAISCFLLLANRLDTRYANGKFRHWYLGKERIYQCYDKDRNLIAVRFKKHRGAFWSGWGGWDERKPFYMIEFYVEKEKRED